MSVGSVLVRYILLTLTRAGFAVHSELLARLALVGFGAGAVEVLLHAVARGLVLAGVGLAGVRGRPAGDLRRERERERTEKSGDNDTSSGSVEWTFKSPVIAELSQ